VQLHRRHMRPYHGFVAAHHEPYAVTVDGPVRTANGVAHPTADPVLTSPHPVPDTGRWVHGRRVLRRPVCVWAAQPHPRQPKHVSGAVRCVQLWASPARPNFRTHPAAHSSTDSSTDAAAHSCAHAVAHGPADRRAHHGGPDQCADHGSPDRRADHGCAHQRADHGNIRGPGATSAYHLANSASDSLNAAASGPVSVANSVAYHALDGVAHSSAHRRPHHGSADGLDPDFRNRNPSPRATSDRSADAHCADSAYTLTAATDCVNDERRGW
jgi:hypothetical protein